MDTRIMVGHPKEDVVLSTLPTYLFNVCFAHGITTCAQLVLEFYKPVSAFLNQLESIDIERLVTNFLDQGIIPAGETSMSGILNQAYPISLN